MPVWLIAGLWGLVGASSLIVGVTIAFCFKMPRAVTTGIMSFGCGVLISAVAYDLLEDGFQEGGIWPIVAGAIAGSVSYAIADWLVSRNGAHHRKCRKNQVVVLSAASLESGAFCSCTLTVEPAGCVQRPAS